MRQIGRLNLQASEHEYKLRQCITSTFQWLLAPLSVRLLKAVAARCHQAPVLSTTIPNNPGPAHDMGFDG